MPQCSIIIHSLTAPDTIPPVRSGVKKPAQDLLIFGAASQKIRQKEGNDAEQNKSGGCLLLTPYPTFHKMSTDFIYIIREIV